LNTILLAVVISALDLAIGTYLAIQWRAPFDQRLQAI